MKITNTVARRSALITVLILGSSAWLSAQDTQTKIEAPDGVAARPRELDAATISTNSQSSQPMKINKSSSLIGSTVKNQQGEELGKIRDLVIDFSSERVAYVVLGSRSGVLSSQKLHAVPLRAFQPDTEGTCLILNADKAKLESAEGFDKDNWPAVGTAVWGAEPFWKDAQGTPGSSKESNLDQQKIQDQLNKDYQDTTKQQKKIEPQPVPEP